MKKYLVNYKVNGVIFESFATQARLDEMKENGSLVCYRSLTIGEMMELAEHGFQ